MKNLGMSKLILYTCFQSYFCLLKSCFGRICSYFYILDTINSLFISFWFISFSYKRSKTFSVNFGVELTFARRGMLPPNNKDADFLFGDQQNVLLTLVTSNEWPFQWVTVFSLKLFHSVTDVPLSDHCKKKLFHSVTDVPLSDWSQTLNNELRVRCAGSGQARVGFG